LRLFGIDRDEDDASVRSVTLNDLMVRLLAPSTPVEQLWRTVPADTRNQMKFAVAMANIGSKEPTMMMLPMGVPQF
jgi:hypothetical protein